VQVVVKDSNKRIMRSAAEARNLELPRVAILPQVGPLSKVETRLSWEHVRQSISSHLSPQHFRNQLFFLTDHFERFREIVEETWPGVQIVELVGGHLLSDEPFSLQIRDGNFVAEVGLMGHGLQMWLQTVWFLARAKEADTVILDEPDVYMHADLQRRLIRYVKKRFPQVILTTHSTEILAEVDPGDMLVIDRKQRQASFASSLPSVQRILESIGSTHNIHLARLWHARRFLLVEGKDLALLKLVHEKLFPESDQSMDAIPHMSIGGWGGWTLALGTSMALKNAASEEITNYCILDSDYHSDEQIRARFGVAAERGVSVHVWQRKEIENYFLVPAVVDRVIRKRIAKRTEPPSVEEIGRQIDALVESKRDEVFDAVSHEILSTNRSLGVAGANRHARELIAERTRRLGGAVHITSGKELVSSLSAWSQSEFGVSLSPISLAQELAIGEIAPELREVISCIEHGERFPDSLAWQLP
jgi:hypothetical protein